MGQQGGGNDKGGMNNMVNRPDNNTTIDNSTDANTQYLEYHYLRRENTLAKKLKHHMEAEKWNILSGMVKFSPRIYYFWRKRGS